MWQTNVVSQKRHCKTSSFPVEHNLRELPKATLNSKRNLRYTRILDILANICQRISMRNTQKRRDNFKRFQGLKITHKSGQDLTFSESKYLMQWTISTFNFLVRPSMRKCAKVMDFSVPRPLSRPTVLVKMKNVPKRKQRMSLYANIFWICMCVFSRALLTSPPHTQTGKNPMLMQNSLWMASQISDYPIVSKYSNYKKSKYFQEKSEGRQTMEMKAWKGFIFCEFQQ